MTLSLPPPLNAASISEAHASLAEPAFARLCNLGIGDMLCEPVSAEEQHVASVEVQGRYLGRGLEPYGLLFTSRWN